MLHYASVTHSRKCLSLENFTEQIIFKFYPFLKCTECIPTLENSKNRNIHTLKKQDCK